MQKAADELMEGLMEKYNKEKVIIFSTLQLYRHDRLDYLKGLHKRAKEKGFKIPPVKYNKALSCIKS